VKRNVSVSTLGIPSLIFLSTKSGARKMDETTMEKYFGHIEFETVSSKGVNKKNMVATKDSETIFERKVFDFMDCI
jgi:hypothetical protein